MQHRAAQRNPCLIHKVAHDNAAKQHAADTKSNAADFDITDPQSHHRNQRQHADGQCYITHTIFPVNNIIINRDYD